MKINHLCEDNFINIVGFLELKDLPNFLLVCKEFYKISEIKYVWKEQYYYLTGKNIKKKKKIINN